MGHRLPTILGKAIDDVIRTLNEQTREDEIVDLIQCIDRMNVLMVELSESATLRPIIDGSSNLTGFVVRNGLTSVCQMMKQMSRYGTKRSQSTFKVIR